MKNSFSKILLAVFVFVSLHSLECKAQFSLTGEWEVNCILERTDESPMTHCAVCSVKLEPSTSSVSFPDFDFIFSNDSLTIKGENESKGTTIYCNRLDILQLVKFTYKGEVLSYKVLPIDKKRIILKEEKSGCLLFLEKE